jgi:hypothetical protein
MLLICAGLLLTSISAHSPAFTALSMEEHKERSQLGEGEGQTGWGKRVYIGVNPSFDAAGLALLKYARTQSSHPFHAYSMESFA